MAEVNQHARRQFGSGAEDVPSFPGTKAKKKLIATFTNSEIGPSHSKHWTSLFSNRNKNAHSGFHIFSMLLHPEPGAAASAPSTSLLAANDLGVTAGLRARFRPPASNRQPPESNRNKVRIEFAVTYSKQRIGSNSNRNKFRGPRISSSTVLEALGEFPTARQRVAVRFARIEKPSTVGQIGLRATRKNVEETKFERPEWIDEVTGILETLNQGVVINDACSRIVFANEIFQRMIGRSAEELVGRVVTEFYPPADVPALVKHIERRQKEGLSQFEFFLPQASGGRLPVLVTARQIEDRDGSFFAVITATDITEQKRAENALREANVQLEQRHREIEEDLLLAARVQQSLAPRSIVWGNGGVETFYQPVRTIGGDFGLVTPGDDYLSIMVCDVSGHGIGSALVANRIYTETMSQIESGAALGPMLRHLNRFVMHNIGGTVFYFTLAVARLNRSGRLLEFAGAGHPPAMIVQPGETPRLLESRSAVLGLLADAVDREAAVEVPLEAGDRVVIYTDGFTESFNARSDMLGVEGLSDIVRETSKLPLAHMKQEIVDRVAAWRSGPAADDMSLVVVEVM